MNPVRISYIREHMGVEGARVLDVGCGGGLAAESLARLGAHVTAVDPSEGV
jgi:2-polyprenyl-6-hydroxyphenyl methylase/3-demethylubiquinone-9 3-methyltransferase